MKKTVVLLIFILFFNTSITVNAKENPDLISIKIVYDNYIMDEELEAAWGFACVITGFEKTILFDTGGNGEILLYNMKRMDIDPGSIDKILISHDHWDHTGGLEAVLEQNPDVEVYLLKSFSPEIKNVADTAIRTIEITTPDTLCENVFTTGELLSDIPEQALVLETQKGLVVITGCAHPGIVAIQEKVKKIYKKNLYWVLGGFHLGKKNHEQLLSIINRLRSEVQYVSPSHCSGDHAIEMFHKEFLDKYIKLGAGKVIDLTE